MAMAAVNFVLVRIEETILKEGELLGGVGVDVNWLKRELRHIQCFLCDADSKCRRGDARAVNWLNEVRDVAYRINDAIDIFLVESNRQKDLSFKEKLKRMWREPKELHKLAIELGNLKKMFEGIMERRINYGIELAQDIMGRSDTYMNMMPYRRTTYQNVDETQVVGLDADRNKILELLRDEKMRRRAVITIVGPGGIGKTTLACMVYKSAMRDFEYHIMLPVSQQFSQKDLLLKMVTEFDYNVPDITETDELILKLREKLGRSKYLIILDDVWNDGLCHLLLEDILPDSKNGSRVLMTSRSIYVAISADCRMSLYKLDFLNDKESRDLLFKKTFFYQELDEEYPNDLLEIADALSKRCKGLPLALIVLGGILSTKDHTYIAWERVLRTMNWQLDGRDCMDVLAMSYDDMSFDLKICFLYLAFFPEDYKISSKRLIKMWIAEGFIPHGGKKSMEEIAEDYLEELLQRNMVEASSRYSNGSIRECRVPGLLYDLAMHKAEQENFVTILPKSQHINHPDRAAYFRKEVGAPPVSFYKMKQNTKLVKPTIKL
ncbi:Disease resistance family protein [Rhynchospora pubera]|uniref:Disease resistance family protein n=1 Tax=Rhynchospora pubera TaxID=906938 RepID=A0AAV8G8Q9_9POAL|nr:Disease resistance family protein [Rhynchospora pubera]